MVSKSDLKGHANVKVTSKSGVVDAPENASNFYIDAPRGDILNYAREGGDLVIEFKDGQKLLIKNFFAHGLESNNLLLSDGGSLLLVDFSEALSGQDGINDPDVIYHELNGADATAVLIGLLGAGGIAAAIAFANKSDYDYAPAVVEAAPPSVPTLDNVYDKVESIVGPIVAGTSTNDPRPTFSGTAMPGTVIKFYDNGQLIGSTVTASDGHWSWEPEADLADGAHSITYTASDGAGTESAHSDPFEFSVDTVAPSTPTAPSVLDNTEPHVGPILPGSSTNETQPEFSGTGEPGSTITIKDGDTVIGTTTVGTDGNWSVKPDAALPEGNHSITVTETDTAGNESSPSAPIDFTVDTTAPVTPHAPSVTDNQEPVTGPVTAGSSTNDTQPEFSGTGEPGSTITIKDGDTVIGTTTVGADGNWSVKPDAPLTEGSHSVTVTETDTAGNASSPSAPIDFTVDTTAPATPHAPSVTDNQEPVTGPVTAGSSTNDTQPEFSGTGEPGSTITIKDGDTVIGTTTVGADGNWSVKPDAPLTEGSHSVTVTETDTAGNASSPSAPIDFTVDTTAPATPSAPSVTDNQEPVIGPVTAGSSTNDTQPEFSGTGEAGSTITIKDGNTVIGTTTVGADGNWSVKPDAPLTEGSHSVTVTETDTAGNESSPSAPIDFTVDTTPPATPSVPTATDNTEPVIGAITAGSSTNETKPEFKGTGEPGSTITIKDGDTVIGTTTADSDGKWTLKPENPLSDGNHSITVTATDAAGNTSTPSGSLDFNVDTVIPNPIDTSKMDLVDDFGPVQGTINRGDPTDDRTPTYSGAAGSVDANDASSINIYNKDANGVVKLIGSTSVNADGSWSFDPNPPLTPGDYIFSARPVDKAGNEGPATTDWNFTLVGDAPADPAITSVSDNEGSVQGALQKNGVTDDTTPVVKGTGEAGSTITIHVEGPDGVSFVGGTTTVNANGSWTIEITPAFSKGDGTYTIKAQANDSAGQLSNMTGGFPVVLDTTAPATPSQPTITDNVGDVTGALSANDTTDDKQPVLSGNAGSSEAGGTVTIKDGDTVLGTTSVGADGSWSFTPPAPGLSDGSHSITVTVTDKAGNESAASPAFNITVDTSNVVVSFSHFEDNVGTIQGNVKSGGISDDRTPVMVGSASANATVTVSYVNAAGTKVVVGTTTADSTGAWSLTPSVDLADGKYSFSAEAVNAAGVKGTVSFTLEIDATAPSAPVINEVLDDVGFIQGPITSGSSTDDTTPTFSGTGEVGSTITIKDKDGTVVGTTTVDSDGKWSVTTDELAEGTHNLTVTSTDAAGNVSDGAQFDVIVDTTGPSATAALQSISDDTGFDTADFITNDTTLIYTIKVTGTLETGDTVWMRIKPENGTAGQWIQATKNDDGTYSVNHNDADHALTDGRYTIETVVRDAAGNPSTPSTQVVTIDTSLPITGYEVAITGFFDDVGLIQGDMTTSGTSTDDTTPLLKGTVTGLQDGDRVVIKVTLPDGSKIILGVATVTEGTWEYQVSDAQAFTTEGQYSFEAVVTNIAGNEGKTSTGFDLNLDLTAPTATSSITGITDDTGFSDSDYITSDDTLIIHGSVSETLNAGEKVQIRIDGGTWVDAVYNATDKTWSYDNQANALSEGDHTIESRVVDAAGNITTGGSQTVTIDKTGPVEGYEVAISGFFDDVGLIQGDMTTSGTSTDDTTPLLKGTVTGIKTGDEVVIKVTGPDGTKIILGNATVTNGTWQYQVTEAQKFVTEGKYTFEAVVTDKAGNEGKTSTGFDLNLDLTAPTATSSITGITDDTGFSDSDYITSDDTLIIHGSVSETLNVGEKVQIRIDGGTWVDAVYNATDKTWSYDNQANALSEGDHTIESRVVDAAGNITTGGSQTVTIDKTGPVEGYEVAISGFFDDVGLIQGDMTTSGTSTDDTTPLLKGTVTGIKTGDEVVIKVTGPDGTKIILGNATVTNGTWQYQVTEAQKFVTEGKYTFEAVVTDKAGNEGKTSTGFDLNLDLTAPTATSSITGITDDTGFSDSDYITSDDTLIIHGSVSETLNAGEKVQIRIDGGTWVDAVYNATDKTWSYDNQANALSEGDHTIESRVVDAAGNITTGGSQTVTIDKTAPIDGVSVSITGYFDDVGLNQGDVTTNNSYTDDTEPLLKGTIAGVADGERVVIKVTDANGVTTVLGVAVVSAGTWEYQVTAAQAFKDGQYTFQAVVTDTAGNEGATSNQFGIIFDTAAPTALSNITSITEDTGNGTNDYVTRDGTLIITAKVTGTLSDNERVQISLDNGTTWRDATYAASTDSWTLDNTDTLLADGTYTFKTRVIDAAGNLGTESSQQVVIDNKIPEATTKITHFSDDQAPQIYDSLPSGSYTDDTTPTLHGTLTKALDEGAAVAIYRGSVFVGYATVTGTTWSFTQPTALSDGTFYTYYAAVQSRSGVNGSLSDAFEIAIDTSDSNMAPNVGTGGAYATYSMSLRLGNNGGWTMMTDMAEYSADGNDFRNFGSPKLLNWANLGNAAISAQYVNEKLFSSYTYGDYNRDGYMDMFLTDRTYDAGIAGSGTGTMFVGKADGTYQATLVQVNSLTHFGSTVSLDMDGDGWLDVVLGDSGNDSSTFLHNKGQAGLDLGTQQWDTYGYPTANSSLPVGLRNFTTDHELSVVDLNNSGAVDLVVHGNYTSETTYNLVTLKNNGVSSATGQNWSFGQRFTNIFNTSGLAGTALQSDSFERTISLTWGDFNGDGYMDLFIGQSKNAGVGAVANTTGTDSMIFYNDGTGNLKDPQRIADGIMGKSTLAIDWDGDGKMDLVEVPEAKYSIGTSLYYHNTGEKDANGQVVWDIKNIKDMGVATAGGSIMTSTALDAAVNGASAAAMDYDWDGDQDLIISRANTTEASIVITNPNTPAYGTAMHLRIVRPDGSNTFYGNTVELYNSAGVRVSSQIINPQYGTGWNDSSAIVHFYGLDPNETYTAVMRFNKNGVSQDFGGKAIVGDGSNLVENVNSSWTNLKATEPYNGYVLTAEADGAVNNTTDYSSSVGIVGTGYNDTFFIGAGTRFYNGGGGWNVGDGERTWDANSGLDIADFAAVGSQGINVNLANTTDYQTVATGFATRLVNIEAIYGTSGNDTITDGNGNNVLNGRGGNDTFTLTGTGHTTLLYENIDNADATGGNGQDVVNQFTLGNYVTNANADRIDLADILIGYVRDADGPAHFDSNGVAKIDVGDNIGDYLRVVQDGGNAVLYVDRDGTGGAFQSTALLTLNNTTTDLATLLANGQIVV